MIASNIRALSASYSKDAISICYEPATQSRSENDPPTSRDNSHITVTNEHKFKFIQPLQFFRADDPIIHIRKAPNFAILIILNNFSAMDR